VVALALGGGAGVARADGPSPVDAAKLLADPFVPGANDWSCRPSPGHPSPVVLVHGLGATASSNFGFLAPAIHDAGYCVFALNYGGVFGIAPMEDSARQLATFVDGVLAATGAAKADIVGHSEGGLMPRYYLRFLGGAAHVDDMVGIAAPNHGTSLFLADIPVGVLCGSCNEFATGSPFLTNLNAGSDVVPGVSFTQLVTRYDEAVLPYTSGYLSGPAGQVTNVTLQDACPSDFSEHVAMAADPVVLQWTLDALGHPGPANPAFQPRCA
jgi:triacylglycerol lipase